MTKRKEDVAPEAGEESAGGQAAGEAKAAAPGRVSAVDRSLVTVPGPQLSPEQLASLRRRLKNKYH